MRKTFLFLLFVLFLASSTGVSHADIMIPSPLAIDFRLPAWNFPGGTTSYTVGNVAVAANIGELTQGSDFGLGIKHGLLDDAFGIDDEVDNIFKKEELTITIAGGMNLLGFYVTKLYADDGIFDIDEAGVLEINGSMLFPFIGVENESLEGDQFIDFGGSINVTSAKFWASCGSFSVVGAPVPEPATMLLLGSGLIGLAGYSRRRFRKK